MTPFQKALLAIARKAYPEPHYADATDEQVLRWLSEDALLASRNARDAAKKEEKK